MPVSNRIKPPAERIRKTLTLPRIDGSGRSIRKMPGKTSAGGRESKVGATNTFEFSRDREDKKCVPMTLTFLFPLFAVTWETGLGS